MSLPASQYSVLDARKIERINDDMFKCGRKWEGSASGLRLKSTFSLSHTHIHTHTCSPSLASTPAGYVGQLKFASWSVEPVLTVSVTVEPEEGGCTIRLLSCEVGAGQQPPMDHTITPSLFWLAHPLVARNLITPPHSPSLLTLPPSLPQLKGSKFVEDLNRKFSASMTNIVRWRNAPPSDEEASSSGSDSGKDKEMVSTTQLRVRPAWCSFLSVSH
jgi:hypothetical protein